MTQELKDFIKSNEETYRLWIDMNETVQLSSDSVSPLINTFKSEFPTVNLLGCKDCVIDMLRWALIQIKTNDTTTVSKGDIQE